MSIPMERRIAELVNQQRTNATSNEKTAIKSILANDIYNPVGLEKLNEREFRKLISLLGVCSKFHIYNDRIRQIVLFLICRPDLVDLYKLIYKKTFLSYEFMLQQHLLSIKPNIESPEKILGDYRDHPIEVHYLIGSVVGFTITGGPEWKSGNRITFL